MNQKDAPQAPAFAKGQHGVGSGGTERGAMEVRLWLLQRD